MSYVSQLGHTYLKFEISFSICEFTDMFILLIKSVFLQGNEK
jgi:hypothetical protein